MRASSVRRLVIWVSVILALADALFQAGQAVAANVPTRFATGVALALTIVLLGFVCDRRVEARPF